MCNILGEFGFLRIFSASKAEAVELALLLCVARGLEEHSPLGHKSRRQEGTQSCPAHDLIL